MQPSTSGHGNQLHSVRFVAAVAAQAAPTVAITTFATGGAVSATEPDSITSGDESVWVEYGNGADSTGASGSTRINPVTGMVGALQNNDGNATLSLINPMTMSVASLLKAAVRRAAGRRTLSGDGSCRSRLTSSQGSQGVGSETARWPEFTGQQEEIDIWSCHTRL